MTTDEGATGPAAPAGLPAGFAVELPGRGTTWAYDTGVPASAAPGTTPPTIVLLHGWTATAALNWFRCFEALSARYRVIALDHRGHGRGIRSRRRFRLEDCADDAVALADVLGVERLVPCGYSMGGPVAQLVWRRHADRVDGLVLCATSRSFRGRPQERALFAALTGLSAAARLAPGGVRRSVAARWGGREFEGALAPWARSEMARNEPRMIAEAGQAIGAFSSHEWIGRVDVPAACVVTERDPVVPAYRQRAMAEAIPGATLHGVASDHGACALAPDLFVPALLDACASVTIRAAHRGHFTG